MEQRQRLFFYIVLNVIVSACTTLAVLWVWERTHPTVSIFGQSPQVFQPVSPASNPTTAAALTPVFTPQTTPLAEGELPVLITIDNVYGVGERNNEIVVLKRTGAGDLDLTGWTLADAEDHAYTFPGLTLYEGGSVQVHTSAGVNTVDDLYWGSDAAAWQSGELVSLFDPQGNVRATFRIP
jgi:hypothetical protein